MDGRIARPLDDNGKSKASLTWWVRGDHTTMGNRADNWALNWRPWCLEEWQWWKQTMTGMALWSTDPLAREVEPTKIPGVTEQDASHFRWTLVWQFSSNIGNRWYPKWEDSSCIVEAALPGVQYWILQPESWQYCQQLDPTIYSFVCVCGVVWKDITGVGMPLDKPAGEDVNLGMIR